MRKFLLLVIFLGMSLAMVAADNVASLRLFEAAGYKQCGLFPKFYVRDVGTADAVCLQLSAL